MKLNEALVQFLQVDRAPQTQATYKKFLKRFIADIGPERPLDLIRPEDINAYVQDMRARKTKYVDHPKRPTEETGLSSTTIHRNIKMLKAFFRWCVKRGYLAETPTCDLTNKRPIRPLGQGKAATEEEVTAILNHAFTPRDKALILVLSRSGCRAGEAVSLRIPDLNLPECEAWVDGKGDKRRKIYFDIETADALRVWLSVRPKVKHNCVFISSRGEKPLTPSGLSQVIRRLCKTASLERSLGAHSFRHYVGLTLARKRVPVRVAQHYLGHASPNITFGYYQDIDEGDLHEATKLLNPEGETSEGVEPKGEKKNKKPTAEGNIIPFPRVG